MYRCEEVLVQVVQCNFSHGKLFHFASQTIMVEVGVSDYYFCDVSNINVNFSQLSTQGLKRLFVIPASINEEALITSLNQVGIGIAQRIVGDGYFHLINARHNLSHNSSILSGHGMVSCQRSWHSSPVPLLS